MKEPGFETEHVVYQQYVIRGRDSTDVESVDLYSLQPYSLIPTFHRKQDSLSLACDA